MGADFLELHLSTILHHALKIKTNVPSVFHFQAQKSMHQHFLSVIWPSMQLCTLLKSSKHCWSCPGRALKDQAGWSLQFLQQCALATLTAVLASTQLSTQHSM